MRGHEDSNNDAHLVALAVLRDPATIRQRCGRILAAARAGESAWFVVDDAKLPEVVERVVAVTRRSYPTLEIPLHSRWRHLDAGGVERQAALMTSLAAHSADERARALIDLVVVSVLLDAGAGPRWHFCEPGTGVTLGRSEGLAVASLHLVRSGVLSSVAEQPVRVDADALLALTSARLEQAFGVDAKTNPLVGVDGRVTLMHGLAHALAAEPELFGVAGRPGHLLDHLKAQACAGVLPAVSILTAVLRGLAPIWPGRLMLGGHNLGDVWRHPAAGGDGPSAGLVPFHKLSQWLSYSLVEPLTAAGMTVTELDKLTALAEYRNGGMLVDLGVLVPRDRTWLARAHPPDAELVVEWRALTVALLDEVARGVRQRLSMSAEQLPLVKVLQGGTWAAGREVAAERRADHSPPIRIVSDGTVF